MNRRILASLVVIGFVAAGIGGTTMAMFNDSETSSNNAFAAGELDLRIDWEESYNGEQVETQELTNDPGTIFDFEDLKPGDHGEATISLHLDDNPGWIWMNLNQTSNWDNACTEPEREAEGQCGSEGELDEELEFTIWADDGDNILQDDENVIFEGTAQELEEASMSEEGVLLDGNPSTNETEAFEGEETGYIGVKWNLPLETGNHIQGDSVSYDVSFYTEQERHNENPDNPWTDSDDNDTEEPENEPPVASFERANDRNFSTTVDNEVRLFSTSTDDDEITKNEWSLGDGTTQFGVDVRHAWNESGNYTVTLEVTDSDGETDTATRVMEVTEGDDNGEPVEPSGNLNFSDQAVNEDGEVTVDSIDTGQDSTVFVTYESENGTVNAGFESVEEVENVSRDIEIEEDGVPGTYTAHIVPEEGVSGYDGTGGLLSQSTIDSVIFSDNAEISAANGEPVDSSCQEPVDPSKEYTADEIAQAKYGYDFENLSEETRCEVEDLFNNQPFAEELAPEDVMTKDEISQDMFDRDYSEISSDSKADVDESYMNQFAQEEETAPSGNLTFNNQEVDDGQVTINNVSTTVDSTVFVTYESGNDTILAGAHNAPANLDNYDPMTVDINTSGVPGEYTARMIEKPIAIGYSPGDVVQDSTLEKQYFSQSAQISAEEEADFTATQGDTTVELEPIEGDETVQEFYDFRLPDNYDNEATRNATNGAFFGSGPYYGSAGTEDLQQGDASLMFLYEGPEGLSFVVVHEGVGSNDGGSATFEITDLNGNGEWVVKDDLYLDDDGTIASSNYDRWNTSSNPQTIDWTWGGGGSDGGAFQPLAEDFEFTIDPAFNEEAGLYDDNFYDGEVDEWQVLSGERDNPDRTTLDMDEEVTVTAN